MGTSGFYGFRFKGTLYVSYNHSDSYPTGLGASIVGELLTALKNNQIQEWMTKVLQLKVVNSTIVPTQADIAALAPYTDLAVSNQSTSDWYCLLRKTQGSLLGMLNSGYVLSPFKNDKTAEQEEFSHYSYGYIVDLDSQTFDFYKDTGKKKQYKLNVESLDKFIHPPQRKPKVHKITSHYNLRSKKI